MPMHIHDCKHGTRVVRDNIPLGPFDINNNIGSVRRQVSFQQLDDGLVSIYWDDGYSSFCKASDLSPFNKYKMYKLHLMAKIRKAKRIGSKVKSIGSNVREHIISQKKWIIFSIMVASIDIVFLNGKITGSIKTSIERAINKLIFKDE